MVTGRYPLCQARPGEGARALDDLPHRFLAPSGMPVIRSMLSSTISMPSSRRRPASRFLFTGLDPGMDMLHSDLKGRDSFVYDVIEPLRPRVDGYLLTILQERTFRAADFFETRQDVCRLIPALTQSLAELSPGVAHRTSTPREPRRCWHLTLKPGLVRANIP